MDRRIIEIDDDYTHARTPRRVFLDRLAKITGSTAAALAILPMLENNYAQPAIVADDPRIATEKIDYQGATGNVNAYLATPKSGPAKRGCVIAIHENRGLNPHIEDVARRVATEGFTALAPDLLSSSGAG